LAASRRNSNDEARAAPGHTLVPQLAPVVANDAERDAQSEAHPPTDRLGGEEGIEDSRRMFRRHSAPGVRYCVFYPVARGAERGRDFPRFGQRHVSERVARI